MVLPANVADGIAAIQDGELGVIEDVMIGDVLVSALSGLSNPLEASITRKPVEAGYLSTDAGKVLPRDLVLDVVLGNPEFSVEAGLDAALTGSVDSFTETWRDKRDTLEGYLKTFEVIDVQTHEGLYSDYLVQRIDPWWDVDANVNALIATVTIFQYRQSGGDGDAGIIDAAKEGVGNL